MRQSDFVGKHGLGKFRAGSRRTVHIATALPGDNPGCVQLLNRLQASSHNRRRQVIVAMISMTDMCQRPNSSIGIAASACWPRISSKTTTLSLLDRF